MGLIGEDNSRKRRQGFNLNRAKHYFSAIEYLRVEDELERDTVVFHLNDNKNSIRGGLTFEAVEQTLTGWPRHNSHQKVQRLNKTVLLGRVGQQCLSNYQAMTRLELRELSSMGIDQIYQMLNQLHAKAVCEFVEGSSEFAADPDYQVELGRLEGELGRCEHELVSNYAQSKKEEGRRIMANLERKQAKKSLDSYTMMKVVGKDEINRLEIGYRMYKEILEGKIAHGFE